jgi:enoyl-CoA hydratase/carnithine racemase
MSAVMQSSNEPLLLRSDDHGVATLTLNRASQFNSLSDGLIDALQAALDAIATDTSVRVVVLAGAGRAFCAGHDLKEMRSHPDRPTSRRCSGNAAG